MTACTPRRTLENRPSAGFLFLVPATAKAPATLSLFLSFPLCPPLRVCPLPDPVGTALSASGPILYPGESIAKITNDSCS